MLTSALTILASKCMFGTYNTESIIHAFTMRMSFLIMDVIEESPTYKTVRFISSL